MSTFGLPFDLQGDQEAVARKQDLAKQLLAKALAPQQTGQMVSGHFVSNGIGNLMPLAAAFLGNKAQGEADQAGSALRGKYNSALASGLENYFSTRDGKPGQTLTDGQAGALLNEDQDPGKLADPVKADPRRAAIQALTSGLGPLQDLGKGDLTTMGKSSLTAKDIFAIPGADLKSRLTAALSGDLSGLTPEDKPLMVNGQVVTKGANGYNVALDARDKYGNLTNVGIGPDGRPLMGQTQQGTGEIKYAPGGAPSTTVNVDTAAKAGTEFAKELAGKRATIVKDSYDKAKLASTALTALGDASKDLAAGVKSGIAGEISLGLAKVGKMLGMEADPAIANTEVFRANMSREVANMVKSFGSGAGISNADREFAEKAAGGTITLDDKSMVRLVNIATAAAGNVMLGHGQLLEQQRKGTGAIDSDIDSFHVPFTLDASSGVTMQNGRFVPPPNSELQGSPAGEGGAKAPISLDDYLKGVR